MAYRYLHNLSEQVSQHLFTERQNKVAYEN